MTKPKYTPGHWSAHFVVDGRGRRLIDIKPTPTCTVATIYNWGTDECEANANLIAAAPDQNNALDGWKVFCDLINRSDENDMISIKELKMLTNPHEIKTRKALAKAEGK